MSFRLVRKSVTINDLERCNGRYIALFHWIWWTCIPTQPLRLWQNLCTSLLYFVVRVRCRRKESSRSLSHLLMSFLYGSAVGPPNTTFTDVWHLYLLEAISGETWENWENFIERVNVQKTILSDQCYRHLHSRFGNSHPAAKRFRPSGPYFCVD